MARPHVLAPLSFALLLACGGPPPGSNAGRAPIQGEGDVCPLPSAGGSGCPGALACASWSAYQSSFGTCRVPCSQGCLTGESCGTDGNCQCTPSAYLGGPGDSCHGIGNLICHPDFHVCLPPAAPGSCKSPLSYAQAWTLCLAS
ncbi:MAG: hypothetical protein ACYCWW_05805 [Deltaproteobacteria bacterium]